MEIYIKIIANDGFNDITLWWNRDEDGCSEFLEKSDTLCYLNEFDDDVYAGTACTSRIEAKNAAKSARTLANWDGYEDIKISFWKFDKNENLIQVKI